jgi:hypothetical protein
MLAQLDADGDGHVSATEVLGAVRCSLDANGDGKVDASEVLAATAGAIGATKTDLANVRVYIKAVTALYGAIIFWYGSWTQFDVGFTQLGFQWATGIEDGSSGGPRLFCDNDGVPDTTARDVGYIMVGTAVLVLTDSLFANAGLPGSFFAPSPNVVIKDGWVRRCLFDAFAFLRVLVSILGSVVLWLGWYNLVANDLCLTDALREVQYIGHLLCYRAEIVFALLLMWATSTLFAVSGVYVEEPDTAAWVEVPGDAEPPETAAVVAAATKSSAHPSTQAQSGGATDSLTYTNSELNAVDRSTSAHVCACTFLRANVSIFAQSVMWLGAYGWLETECWFEPCDGVLWRELFYCSVGLALFFASDAFLDNSMIDEAYEQDEYEIAKESKASRASFAARCMVALAGSVAHNTGVWTILDEYVNSESWRTCSSSDGASHGAISCSVRNLACMTLGTHLASHH